MLKEYLSNIANAIRSKLGTTDTINAQEFPDKVSEVYDKGRNDEGGLVWSGIQLGGARKDYSNVFNSYALSNEGWNDDNFKPQYDMHPTNLTNAFRYSKISDFDLIIKKQGIIFDTSECTIFNNAWQNSNDLTHLPMIDASNAESTNYGLLAAFSYCRNLKSVRMKVSENGNQPFSNTFTSCTALSEFIVESGIIGRSISFQYSPLSVESMKSVISCLANYKGTDSEATYSVKFTDACWEALEASGTPYADGLTDDVAMTWQNYVTEVLGWTI